MEVVKEYEKNNKILGKQPMLLKSNISFNGKNNILICEENVILENSIISFNGDNSVVYLSQNKNKYYLNVSIFNNSVLYFDENCYINGKVNMILSEGKNIIVGKDCLFSFGIWLRLADPHLIYDMDNGERINYSKSIYIGDHVWIGQDAMILKGTQIGSGSIIGAKSLVTGKRISSNTMWGGNPAKEIKSNIFYDSRCVHSYTSEETEKTSKNVSQDWIYTKDENTYCFDELEEKIEKNKNIEERIKLLIQIRNIKSNNRFYM